MAEIVYVLCAFTSIVCSVLLFRAWRSSRSRLLLWSGLCFAGLSINNLMLFFDLVVMPDQDIVLLGVPLPLVRSVTALVSVMTLVFGLIWESQ
jgi:cytochrome c biogenesis factor